MQRRTPSVSSPWIAAGAVACVMLVAPLAAIGGAGETGVSTVRSNCSGCHRETAPGHFDRISDERKTPEGWAMTLFRMRQVHGLQLTSGAQAAVIRYLSDAQGLAPSESAAGRFALERRPDAKDLQLPGALPVVCGRCHSLARAALQRRTAAEWLKLVNMHVGQWPSLEYQDRSRDLHWWQIATTYVPGELAKLFPLDSAAWSEWKTRPHADLTGDWIVRGNTPGRGDYYGTAAISRTTAGEYSARYTLRYSSGPRLDGSSTATVYTGYQWRGTATFGGKLVHEVYFASADGSRISGRWFLADHSEIGGDWDAERATGAPRVMAAIPQALKAGTSARIVLVGYGLRGPVSFGAGTSTRVLARTAYGLDLQVSADGDAAPGYRAVRAGALERPDTLALYRTVDRVAIEPAFAVARLGGGQVAAVDAQFEAIGYAKVRAADGSGAAVRLGPVHVAWTLEPFDAEAARLLDVRYAGALDSSGCFVPAQAGPDPSRRFSTDNTGNLFVVGTLEDATRAVVGKAHLIVTVQRWNNPPIY
jgi:quinohemoprotein amine dehydrogenase